MYHYKMVMTMPELKAAKLVFGLLGWAELRPKCNPLMINYQQHLSPHSHDDDY